MSIAEIIIAILCLTILLAITVITVVTAVSFCVVLWQAYKDDKK